MGAVEAAAAWKLTAAAAAAAGVDGLRIKERATLLAKRDMKPALMRAGRARARCQKEQAGGLAVACCALNVSSRRSRQRQARGRESCERFLGFAGAVVGEAFCDGRMGTTSNPERAQRSQLSGLGVTGGGAHAERRR